MHHALQKRPALQSRLFCLHSKACCNTENCSVTNQERRCGSIDELPASSSAHRLRCRSGHSLGMLHAEYLKQASDGFVAALRLANTRVSRQARSAMTHTLGSAVLQEESRVVIIRFGHDWDQVCMQMDEVLLAITPLSCHLFRNACKCPAALLPCSGDTVCRA